MISFLLDWAGRGVLRGAAAVLSIWRIAIGRGAGTVVLAVVVVGGVVLSSGRAEALWQAGVAEDSGGATTRDAAEALTTRPATTSGAAEVDDSETSPCRRYEDSVSASDSLGERARACLDAARCVLVTGCAPLLSGRAFGGRGSREGLSELAGEGLAYLNCASASLSSSSSGGGGSAEVAELEDRIAMLRAFGETFSALGEDPSSSDGRRRLVRVCRDLAIYLNDDNAKVAESARLWVGVAYRQAGRPERTLQVLRLVLSGPASLRLGLAARVQRCLALGDRGEHVAAVALCSRLALRVEVWFADEDAAVQAAALETVRLTRAEMLRGWASSLRSAGQTEEAQAVEAEASRIVEGSGGGRLSLVETIAGLPQWDDEASGSIAGQAERRREADGGA